MEHVKNYSIENLDFIWGHSKIFDNLLEISGIQYFQKL